MNNNQTDIVELRKRAFRMCLAAWIFTIICVSLACVTLQHNDHMFTYIFGTFGLLFVLIAGIGLGVIEGSTYIDKDNG